MLFPCLKEGEDSINNTIALCPNCHRALHYANNRQQLREMLLNYLRNL
ncbi:MAG: HNH endonuclease [Sulfurovum sp.]|nr:HNH endonuclease [Sulfurovum sp.]MCB4745798.1 HNH endonuclease [Sulfurovum sp.]MCB4750826.1 HNH endonuclease [Sulfurovum sp.]MCB4752108.1 HNH endonuclease [Sulfurovum sp.]MCB4755060.1 HNH endonuclease [Sulfurovum sp.]